MSGMDEKERIKAKQQTKQNKQQQQLQKKKQEKKQTKNTKQQQQQHLQEEQEEEAEEEEIGLMLGARLAENEDREIKKLTDNRFLTNSKP